MLGREALLPFCLKPLTNWQSRGCYTPYIVRIVLQRQSFKLHSLSRVAPPIALIAPGRKVLPLLLLKCSTRDRAGGATVTRWFQSYFRIRKSSPNI